jgi:hypothetical protein
MGTSAVAPDFRRPAHGVHQYDKTVDVARSNPQSPNPGPDDEAALERIIASFLEAHEAPSPGDIAQLCKQYPDFSKEIVRRIDVLHRLGLFAAPPPAEAPIPEQLGEFRLLRPLGGGGMGVVYEAEQTSLGRVVALKLIRPEHLYFPGAHQRFRREVETVARLQHPGIVPIYTVGEERGIPYFAMEKMHGCTLAEVLEHTQSAAVPRLAGKNLHRVVVERAAPGSAATAATVPPLFEGTWNEACLRIVRDVALALQHAHDRGVIHRDVKPSNIFIKPEGRALLFDFGLASSGNASTLTRSGSQVGSVPYMSPEVVGGDIRHITHSTDIYSLGVTLYEMLTLHSPFFAESVDQTQKRILHDDPAPPRLLNSTITQDMATVCLKAMDRDRTRRYATASAFAQDLQNILDRRPIDARPPSMARRAQRWIQRHPARAVAGASAALFLLGGPLAFAVVTHFHNREIEQALERESEERNRAERNFGLAVAAVDQMLSRVGSERLKSIPQAEPVRRQLLEDALVFSERILQSKSDSPVAQREKARALVRVGEIRQRLDARAEAHAAFEEGLALLETLAAASPSDAAVQLELAHALRVYGSNLTGADELQRGIQLMERAVAMHRLLVHDAGVGAPAIQYKKELLEDLENLGSTLRLAHRMTDARTTILEGIALATETGSPWRPLVGLYSFLAMIEADEKQFVESEKASRRAIEILEAELKQGTPEDSPDIRKCLATSYNCLATTFSRSGRARDAIEWFKKVVEQREALCTDFPWTPAHRHLLGQSYNNLALAYQREALFEDAEPYFKKAVDTISKLADSVPGILEYQLTLVGALTNYGGMLERSNRIAEAIDILSDTMGRMESVCAAHERNAEVWFSLANISNNLGSAYLNIHRYAEAEAPCRKAVSAILRAGTLTPDSTEAQYSAGIFMNNLGCLLRDMNRPKEAEPILSECYTRFSQLRGRISPTAEFALFLAQSSSDLAMLYIGLHDHGKAAQFIAWSVQHFRDLLQFAHASAETLDGIVEQAIALGKTHAMLGDTEAIGRLAAELPSRAASAAEGHRLAAAVLAAASVACGDPARATSLGTAAMTSLQMAIGAGYNDVENLLESPELATFKNREDFGTMIQSIRNATR